jgi:hypothetical protein
MNNGVAIKKALARPDVRKKMREQANRAWADAELRQERILDHATSRRRKKKAEGGSEEGLMVSPTGLCGRPEN